MKLPFLTFLKSKPNEEFFLALVLRDEKVSALIFKQVAGKVFVVSKNEVQFAETLEETPLDELVSILDKTISHAETKLPADIEIKDTVFGVKDSWVVDKKINKEYLSRLKHVCNELSLTPIGFIVLSEAIAHLIQQEEAAPVTALITEVGENIVTVSLFKAGKLLETVNKHITDTPMSSVDEALKEFEKIEILPSRIILFQSSNTGSDKHSDDLSQKFIAHQWSKTLPFLQIPQISILPNGFDGKAIVAGAAAQLGYTLASLPEDIAQHEIKTIESKYSRKTDKENSFVKPDTDSVELHNKDTEGENFGFVLNKDIAAIPVSDTGVNKIPTPDEYQNDELIPQKDEKHTTQHEIKINDNLPKNLKKNKKISLTILSVFLSKLKSFIPKNRFTNRKIIFIPPIVITLLIGLTILYYFQLRANVTFYVSQKSVSETERITLSTKLENDFEQNIIAAKEISVSLEGSSTIDTTGEKEVGEKAKGAITIFNSDTEKKTFKEGTVVTSEKGLTFVTDKEVSVASASGDIFTGIKSGTSQVAITAGKIGTEYNLPSNSKFSLEDSDTVAAKNDTAIAGGTKKKVTVVTEKDIEKLKKELPKSLEAKAKEELQKKLGGNEELLTGFTEITLAKEKFDHEIDDEAKSLKLTGIVSFKSIAYDKEDLLQFAQESLKAKYTKDNLSENNIDTTLSGIKDKNATELTGVAAINAGLLPKIEIQTLKSDLKGLAIKDAIDFSKNVSKQINNVEIKLIPDLPFLPEIMPQRSENISIDIKPS